jgi:ubiquinone/menaquinone biosynthesis C-methylase UbiE
MLKWLWTPALLDYGPTYRMVRFWRKDQERIVYISDGLPHSQEFWDREWDVSEFSSFVQSAGSPYIVETTRRYLPPGSKILEGGCGAGQQVYALERNGFQAHGVDFAPLTVRRLNTAFPHLRVTLGDVENLDFPDNYFDGYWSLGVIEHFYRGYHKVLREMHRVIKPGGVLFLSFPTISALRRVRVSCSAYPMYTESIAHETRFYQYALPAGRVSEDLNAAGFIKLETMKRNGVKGLGDEIRAAKSFMEKVSKGKSMKAAVLRALLEPVARRFAHHEWLLIFRNNK